MRLRKILEACNVPYEEHSYNPQDREYRNFLFCAPIHTKILGEDWYQCTQHQLQIFTDEILYWDGSIVSGKKTFSTCDKDTADFVQFAFSSVGKRASIYTNDRVGKYRGSYMRKSVEYQVTITDRNMVSITNSKGAREIPYVVPKDGYKYCFTVPSGMLVLRRNGRINITGNSGKTSWLYQLVCNTLDQGVGA